MPRRFRDTPLATDRAPGLVLALALGLVLSLTACGSASSTPGSSSDAGAPASQDGEETTPAPSEASGGGQSGGQTGGGTATLTIGSETWEFSGFMCAFGHEATQSDVYSFSSNAFGEHTTGARLQMQADIRDESGQGRYEGDGIIYELTLNDISDFENPSVSWSSDNRELIPGTGSGDAVVHIDGNHLTAEGNFDDGRTDEIEKVPGTLDATCGGA